MRRLSAWHTGLVLVVVMLSSTLLADGGVLRYRHGLPPVLEQEVAYLGRQQLKPAEEKPELRAEPEPGLTGEPTYFLVELGEKDNPPYVALFDPGANDGKGALYFDTDHDGDLAEEEPTPVQRWGGTDNFGPIAVKLKRDGFRGLYHCWIERRQYRGSIGERWYLRPGCYNTGEITFEGATFRAALVDSFPNGRFNDICWSQMGQGDVLYVDWNGDGKFARDEYVMCGERYWREGKWYRLSFSTDGAEVTFAPGDFELAPLLVGHDNFWMQISSRSNVGAVRVEGTGGRVDVPVDEYSLYLAWIEATDDQGNTWEARAVTGGPYPHFEVKAGQENHFAFGPPFSVTLKPSPSGPYRAGQVISFQAALASADGKTYVFSRNGQRMPAPKMVIRDESGKEIGSYSFRYG